MRHYNYSPTVIGGLSPDLKGDWENIETYEKGDVVRYWGKYWRAVRHVDPPLLPVFQSGEVPGDSDAWREISSSEVIYGAAAADDVGTKPMLLFVGALAAVLGFGFYYEFVK